MTALAFEGQERPCGFYYRPKRNPDKIWEGYCPSVKLLDSVLWDHGITGFSLMSWRIFVPEEYSNLRGLIIGLFHMIILQRRMCALWVWAKQVHDRFMYKYKRALARTSQEQDPEKNRLFLAVGSRLLNILSKNNNFLIFK